MEDKELKERLKKIPDTDKNGDPIYKIDEVKGKPDDEGNRQRQKNRMDFRI